MGIGDWAQSLIPNPQLINKLNLFKIINTKLTIY